MSTRSRFVAKHGRHAWDSKMFVGRYMQIGGKRDKGKTGTQSTSIRTSHQYRAILKNYSISLHEHFKTTLDQATPDQHRKMFKIYAEELSQGVLDNIRIAIQKGINTKEKYKNVKFERIKSEVPQILKSRAHTKDAIKVVLNGMTNDRAQVATRVVNVTGLRTAEIYPLRMMTAKEIAAVNWGRVHPDKPFTDWVPYTTQAKGGKIPTLMIPKDLSRELQQYKLDQPQPYKDRGHLYQIEAWPQVYNLVGGNNLSSAWTKSSTRELGYSKGIHGIRHSYAQRRMDELQRFGLTYTEALGTVSREMSHERPEITLVYLR